MRLRGLLLAGLACISAASAVAQPQTFTVVAHRGLGEGMPENTLAAFRRSLDQGLSVIELDVRTTKDGHLVILHDETLDRTTDCSGSLAQYSFERARRCDAGWPGHPGERIPTLGEAIDLVRDRPARLLLDIKPGTSVPAVLEAIRDRHAESKAILGLRRVADVYRARTEAPGVTVVAFMPDIADASEFASAGAHIIRLWSDWVKTDPALVSRVSALGPQVWIMVGRKLPKRDVEWLSLHARMIATGPHGLITNRPELMSAP